MNSGPPSHLKRYVLIAECKGHDGVISFDFIATSPERAVRRAWMAAFTYFREEEFTLIGTTTLPFGAPESDVDRAVDQLCVEGDIITRDEAFGR